MNPASTVILVYACFAMGIFVFTDLLLVYLTIRVFGKNTKISEVLDAEAHEIPDFNLPLISILLPVYREEITLPNLVKSIANSDYPKDKLDVRILVEPDDYPTLKTIMSLADQTSMANGIKYNIYGFPTSIRVWEETDIHIDYIHLNPPGARTKANSLNQGLAKANGDIVTIYDAEDKPDPKQLRKMATYMLRHPDVACVQARLAYYNPDQSIITKLFSIEYIQHYLLLLPSLYSMKKVILLGGTSNFFRIEILKRLNGWKTDNVTEDADMGVRLARLGYKVVPIDTITWEEAPPKIYPWIRQRTRWNKGYLYTLGVHLKNPLSLIRDVGFGSTLFLVYQLFSPIAYFVSIPGWFFFVSFWLNYFGILSTMPLAGWIQEAYESNSVIFYLSLLTFIFGVIYTPIMAQEALFRQGDRYALKKVKYAYLMPFYMYLQCIPATIAIFELLFRPKVWHKTYHGFSIKTKNPKQIV
jgi:cellulose synthase/poly-beta-1,6-N-acetylglucosamine synthase-like glycosyltransferase